MSEEEGAPVNLRLAAEQYARLGLLVFPLAPRSKTPLTPRGLHDATDDLDQIRAWWTQWPDANIGIRCGAMSGLFVVDVDGEEGATALVDLEGAHGTLPPGPEVRTGKGSHRWLRSYPGARNSASKLGPHIDTRGEGGYVVAPPSVHPNGTRYTWTRPDGPHREWPHTPAWIVDALARTAPPAATEASDWQPASEREAERARRYCLGALQRTHDDLAAAYEGTRNERLRDAAYSLAGYVHTGHLAEIEIRNALLDACRKNGAWASEPHKCRDTMERAIAAGLAAPRDIPAPRLALVRLPPPAPDYDAPHPADIAEPAADTRTPAEVVPMGPPPPPARTWKPILDLINALGDFGEPLPVYLPTLDEWTRGGLRRGNMIGIGGAPGAGKTTLALQIGHVYHDQGHPVLVYAADEDRSRLLVRWGQQCGLVREALEKGDRETIATLAWHARKDLIDFVDPSEVGIDEAGAWLAHRSAEVGKIGVLVVDSLQTCRVRDDDGIEPKRRVDRVVGALKSLASAGLLVVVTSEVSRGFYRSQIDKIDPLAAFKESGSIEYALGVGLVLESVKGEVGQTDVYIAKNRLGRTDRHEPAMRLRLDFDRATLTEIKREEIEVSADISAADEEKAGQVMETIYRGLLMASHPIVSRDGLYDLVTTRKQLKVRAVSRLIAEGRVVGGRGEPFRCVPQTGDE